METVRLLGRKENGFGRRGEAVVVHGGYPRPTCDGHACVCVRKRERERLSRSLFFFTCGCVNLVPRKNSTTRLIFFFLIFCL